MTDLQKVVYHDSDCSCYTSIIDVDGQAHDCDICDCGKLRETVRNPPFTYSQLHLEVLNKCWLKHLIAINNQK